MGTGGVLESGGKDKDLSRRKRAVEMGWGSGGLLFLVIADCTD